MKKLYQVLRRFECSCLTSKKHYCNGEKKIIIIYFSAFQIFFGIRKQITYQYFMYRAAVCTFLSERNIPQRANQKIGKNIIQYISPVRYIQTYVYIHGS